MSKAMKSTATSSTMTEANEVMKDMNKDLTKVCDRLRERLCELSSLDIMARFAVGADLKMVTADVRTYGENAVNKLASAMGISPSVLYDFRSLAQVWSKDELQKLVDRRTSLGCGITCSHLYMIASVPQDVDRKKLIEKTFKESLSVRDLKDLIQEMLGVRGKGRSMAPRSPEAGIASMSKVLGNYRKTHEAADMAVFAKIDQEPESFAEESLLSKLEALDIELNDAITDMEEDRRKIATALDVLMRIQRAEEETVVEDDEDEDEDEDEESDVPFIDDDEELEEEEDALPKGGSVISKIKAMRGKGKKSAALARA